MGRARLVITLAIFSPPSVSRHCLNEAARPPAVRMRGGCEAGRPRSCEVASLCAARPQGCEVARLGGCEAARRPVSQGGCEAGSTRGRLRGWQYTREAASPPGRKAARPQYAREATRPKSCEGARVRGREGARLRGHECGCEAARPRARLQGYTRGCKAARLRARLRGCARGCGATTRPHEIASTPVQWPAGCPAP